MRFYSREGIRKGANVPESVMDAAIESLPFARETVKLDPIDTDGDAAGIRDFKGIIDGFQAGIGRWVEGVYAEYRRTFDLRGISDLVALEKYGSELYHDLIARKMSDREMQFVFILHVRLVCLQNCLSRYVATGVFPEWGRELLQETMHRARPGRPHAVTVDEVLTEFNSLRTKPSFQKKGGEPHMGNIAEAIANRCGCDARTVQNRFAKLRRDGRLPKT